MPISRSSPGRDLELIEIKYECEQEVVYTTESNTKAPLTPELATRGVLWLSVKSHSRTMKNYTPQIESRGFLKEKYFQIPKKVPIINHSIWKKSTAKRTLIKIQNSLAKFKLDWALSIFVFWAPVSSFILTNMWITNMWILFRFLKQ